MKTYSCKMCRPKLAGRREGAPLLFTKGPRIGNGAAPRPPRRSSLCRTVRCLAPPALCLCSVGINILMVRDVGHSHSLSHTSRPRHSTDIRARRAYKNGATSRAPPRADSPRPNCSTKSDPTHPFFSNTHSHKPTHKKSTSIACYSWQPRRPDLATDRHEVERKQSARRDASGRRDC